MREPGAASICVEGGDAAATEGARVAGEGKGVCGGASAMGARVRIQGDFFVLNGSGGGDDGGVAMVVAVWRFVLAGDTHFFFSPDIVRKVWL